jgi:hypothetical protein
MPLGSEEPAPAPAGAPTEVPSSGKAASPAPRDNLLPPKKKLHPWEVESAIPEPGDSGENLPLLLRPPYRFYRYAVSTPRRRNFYVQATRAVLIVGMVLVVTAIIYPELVTTDVPATDPLTNTWTLVIRPDNSSAVSGLVDGDDAISGNFTVLSPVGAQVAFDVLPSGSGTWQQDMGQNVYVPAIPPGSTAKVFFSADYTDWYFFVFSNPNAYNVTVFVDFSYLSSLPPA